jgi:hypothetical protein
MFLPLVVHALVSALIKPHLTTFTLLEVIHPLALILAAIGIVVSSEAVGLIVLPRPFENIAIDMVEHPMPMSLIILPVAFIACTIRPHLNTVAMSLLIFPLALIDGSIGEGVLSIVLLRQILVLGGAIARFVVSGFGVAFDLAGETVWIRGSQEYLMVIIFLLLLAD